MHVARNPFARAALVRESAGAGHCNLDCFQAYAR